MEHICPYTPLKIDLRHRKVVVSKNHHFSGALAVRFRECKVPKHFHRCSFMKLMDFGRKVVGIENLLLRHGNILKQQQMR